MLVDWCYSVCMSFWLSDIIGQQTVWTTYLCNTCRTTGFSMQIHCDPKSLTLLGDHLQNSSPFLSVLTCLSVMLVYCGQTVGWIKMKRCKEGGLDPGHIVLDGDQAPPKKGAQHTQFSAHVCCGQTAGWIRMPLGMEDGNRPRLRRWRHCVRWGPSSPPQKGAQPFNFRHMSIVAKWLDGSRCHLVQR